MVQINSRSDKPSRWRVVYCALQSNLFITDRNKCPYYRGVSFREVGFIWISVSRGPSELSVIERCPYYRGVRIIEVSVRRGSTVLK